MKRQVPPGSLLVATPRLRDPNFRRAVVYIITTDDDGALGIVLNRPSQTAVATMLPPWGDAVARPQVIYRGGPVGGDSALAVGVAQAEADIADSPQFQRVTGNTVLVDLGSDPIDTADKLRGVRIYVGYAGWGAGQLEAEIAEEAWWVLPALPNDLLAGPRVDLWFAVLRRQPYPLALQAYHPGDVARN